MSHQRSEYNLTLYSRSTRFYQPEQIAEFGLWFLRENGLVLRGDNARYSITAKGAQGREQCDGHWLRADRMRPAVDRPNQLFQLRR